MQAIQTCVPEEGKVRHHGKGRKEAVARLRKGLQDLIVAINRCEVTQRFPEALQRQQSIWETLYCSRRTKDC